MHRSIKINNAWKVFAVILIVNLLQSVFSPLLNDEPYYWLYAQYPSWGYFDHPPMIAFLIRIGTYLLPHEIGVRLLSLLLGSFTYFLVYKIIDLETTKPVNFKLIALLLFSSLFLNLYSFLAIPDTPLLFFSALFLYTYRRYLQSDSLINTLLMGVVTAMLLYSKYHGVLLVGFTVLSNIKLLRRRSFYLVLAISVALYMPHIYWQVQNDYPTIRFQLLQRSNSFGFDHVFNYLGEQAALTGPVILLLFSILYKPVNQFQRTLKFNVAGIFLFFLFSSFKESVNMHWTAIAWPGLLCLTYLYVNNLQTGWQYIRWALPFNLLIVILFRINFLFDFIRIPNFNDKNPRVLASVLEEKSLGHPLVFKDMYNEPSYAMFYGHEESFAVNDIWYKQTQFNYLPQLEHQFQGKTVSVISNDPINATSQKVSIPKGKEYYITIVQNFSSYNCDFKVNARSLKYLNAAGPNTMQISIENKLDNAAENFFRQHKGHLILNLINKETNRYTSVEPDKPLDISSKKTFIFAFNAPLVKGAYTGVFSLVDSNSFAAGFNSDIYNIQVR